ncbi:hypothetical protein [Streptomyces ardesiacus]|uniref:hypothetical protein n=1 Tax=Streptomyces ardesiacus TaxID=285564 RepID=UPI00381ECDD5
MRDAALTNYSNALAFGVENGGIELFCRLCEETFAYGGCECCDDNEVTVSDLVQATRDHICKEPTNV